jgi:hypothetical protein
MMIRRVGSKEALKITCSRTTSSTSLYMWDEPKFLNGKAASVSVVAWFACVVLKDPVLFVF